MYETDGDKKAEADRNRSYNDRVAETLAKSLLTSGDFMSLLVEKLVDQLDIEDLAEQVAAKVDVEDLAHKARKEIDFDDIIDEMIDAHDLQEAAVDKVKDAIDIEDLTDRALEDDDFKKDLATAVVTKLFGVKET